LVFLFPSLLRDGQHGRSPCARSTRPRINFWTIQKQVIGFTFLVSRETGDEKPETYTGL